MKPIPSKRNSRGNPLPLKEGDDPKKSPYLNLEHNLPVPVGGIHGQGTDRLYKGGKRRRVCRGNSYNKRIGPRRKGSRATSIPSATRLRRHQQTYPGYWLSKKSGLNFRREIVVGDPGHFNTAPVPAPTAEFIERVKSGKVPGMRWVNGMIESFKEVDVKRHKPRPTGDDVSDADIISQWAERKW